MHGEKKKNLTPLAGVYVWTRLKSSFDSLTNHHIVLGSALFPREAIKLTLSKTFAS